MSKLLPLHLLLAAVLLLSVEHTQAQVLKDLKKHTRQLKEEIQSALETDKNKTTTGKDKENNEKQADGSADSKQVNAATSYDGAPAILYYARRQTSGGGAVSVNIPGLTNEKVLLIPDKKEVGSIVTDGVHIYIAERSRRYMHPNNPTKAAPPAISRVGLNLDSESYQKLLDLPAYPGGLSVSSTAIYWTGDNDHSIYSCSRDGSNVKKIYEDPGLTITGLGAGGNSIFWAYPVSSGSSPFKLFAADKEGKNKKLVLDSISSFYATDKYLFWEEFSAPSLSRNARVFRSNHDGSGRVLLFESKGQKRMMYVACVFNNRIYWNVTGDEDYGIYSSDMNGNDLKLVKKEVLRTYNGFFVLKK